MLAVKESKFGNVKKPITGLRDSTKFEELALIRILDMIETAD